MTKIAFKMSSLTSRSQKSSAHSGKWAIILEMGIFSKKRSFSQKRGHFLKKEGIISENRDIFTEEGCYFRGAFS